MELVAIDDDDGGILLIILSFFLQSVTQKQSLFGYSSSTGHVFVL